MQNYANYENKLPTHGKKVITTFTTS